MSPRVITFHYHLTDTENNVLDSSLEREPLSYLEGAGQIIPGLEQALGLLNERDKRKITVPASEAYGERDERYIVSVPRKDLPQEEIQIGDEFLPEQQEDAHPFRVIEIAEDYVVLDANHPLAGVDLTFDVEVVNIREATEDEIEHHHAHGLHGEGH